MWGGQVNRPFAMALDAAWQERFGQRLEIFPGNDCIAFLLPHKILAEEMLSLVSLRQMLDELESGVIAWSVSYSASPSPLAQGISWDQVNKYMYMGDEPLSGKSSNLRGDLLRDFVFSPELRPSVSSEIIEQFELKRQRLSPGYAPQTPRDLVDWVKERLLIPLSEWHDLQKVMRKDWAEAADTLFEPVKEKLVKMTLPGAREPLITALETMPQIVRGFYSDQGKIHVELLTGADISDSLPASGKIVANDRDELLISLLGDWLQYYGPKTIDFIHLSLGIEDQSLQMALEDLAEAKKIILGRLVLDNNESLVCDGENFEILLRLKRVDVRPAFEPLEIEQLPVFLAQIQGLTRPADKIEDLFHGIEQLLCLPLPAQIWESEVFPARLKVYDITWLDSIMQAGDLRWIGSQKQRTAFCFEPDLELMQEDAAVKEDYNLTGKDSAAEKSVKLRPENLEELFPNSTGRYNFSALLSLSKISPGRLSKQLWKAVWGGHVTNDTFTVLRRGIETQFKVSEIPGPESVSRRQIRRSGGRTGFNVWKRALPFVGNWFLVPNPELSGDLLELEERKKDRVRLLLDRYGILFRELLQREMSAFRWAGVFRSLRLMELSGELLAGYFFKDIPGPQFISHQAFRTLQGKLPEKTIYWLNATDPASLCGMTIDLLKMALPKRLASNHLVYNGSQLVMVSKRNGKSLTFHVPPDDSQIQEYLCLLRHLMWRQFQPVRQITVEAINGEEAAQSAYVAALKISFEVLVEFKKVTLYRKIS